MGNSCSEVYTDNNLFVNLVLSFIIRYTILQNKRRRWLVAARFYEHFKKFRKIVFAHIFEKFKYVAKNYTSRISRPRASKLYIMFIF